MTFENFKDDFETGGYTASTATFDLKEEETPATEKFFTKRNPDWQTAYIPPVEPLIEGLIDKGEHMMIWSASGSGKSYFTMGLAVGMASGRGIGEWAVERPYKVLYVEGEMSKSRVIWRLRSLSQGDYKTAEGMLEPITSDDMRDNSFNMISDPEGFNKWLLAEGFEVVVFDNLDCLVSTEGDGGSNSDTWGKAIGEAVSKIGKGNIFVLCIHHATKEGGNYRGTASLRNRFGTIMKIKPDGEQFGSEQDAKVWTYEIEKTRSGGPRRGKIMFGAQGDNFKMSVEPGLISGSVTPTGKARSSLQERNSLSEEYPALFEWLGDCTTTTEFEDLHKRGAVAKAAVEECLEAGITEGGTNRWRHIETWLLDRGYILNG